MNLFKVFGIFVVGIIIGYTLSTLSNESHNTSNVESYYGV